MGIKEIQDRLETTAKMGTMVHRGTPALKETLDQAGTMVHKEIPDRQVKMEMMDKMVPKEIPDPKVKMDRMVHRGILDQQVKTAPKVLKEIPVLKVLPVHR
jgi:hypothetical protein